MMERQTILWTALPNGTATVDGKNVLRLSVFAGLRLYSSSTGTLSLSSFPDMKAWTARVRDQLSLSVVLENGASFDASQIGWDKSVLEPDLWTALFGETMPVTPYAFDDMSGHPILSYSVKNVESYIQSQYTDIAVDYPSKFPEAAMLAKKLDKVTFLDYSSSAAAPAVSHRKALQQRFTAMSTRVRGAVEKTINALLKVPNATLRSDASNALDAMAKELESKKMIESKAPDATRDFMQFQMFHASQNAPEQALAHTVLPPNRLPVALPQIDFHQALSSLGDYPELLKKLGLVIDLTIPYTGSVPAGTAASVVPAWKVPFGLTTIDVPSKTVLESNTFRTAARPGSDIKNGLLDLGDTSAYDIVDLDVDGAAFKLMHTAQTVRPFLEEEKAGKPRLLADAGQEGMAMAFSAPVSVSSLIKTDQSLPSLRSSGISVVRANRPAGLLTKVVTYGVANTTLAKVEVNPALLAGPATGPTPSKPAELRWYADDLVRGYRIDVWDSATTAWHSLCKRKGTYTFTNQTNVQREISDEGIVSMALTRPMDGSTEDLRLHESIFKWDGWSLVAPRPGKVIDKDDKPQDITNTPQTPTGLQVQFVPQGNTLPKLRFGTKYRLRARVVDLAGNSRWMEEYAKNDFANATAEKTYLRYDPVGSPIAVLRDSVKPGEALENVVIRSNYDKSTGQYAGDHSLADAAAERHLAAPQVTQLMAETHGKFDGLSAPDGYKLMTTRDGSLDPADEQETGGKKTVIVKEALVTLPYLPDPMSRGASLTFYDRKGKLLWTTKMVEFYPGSSAWPDPVSMRIRVVEGTGDPKWEADGSRVLTVYLPKAELIRVRYSSYMNEEQLLFQGIWEWVDSRSPANKADLKSTMVSGKHWMVTPFREMTLVHAVQQPLTEPVFTKFAAVKEKIGATYALIHSKFGLDGKSTIRLDVQAEWEEPIDDLLAPEPSTITGKASVFDLTVADSDTDAITGDPNTPVQEPPVESIFELSNAGALMNTSGGAALPGMSGVKTGETAKLIESANPNVAAKPEATTLPLENKTAQFPAQTGAQAKNVAVVSGFAAAPILNLFKPKKHEFGDTKYRKVRYHAVATTRFREYFLDLIDPARYGPDAVRNKGTGKPLVEVKKAPPLPLTRETTTEIKILNSARPALPRLEYVIPTFEWERKDDGDSIISRRCGGGLRVYLDRPWYSSGDEEKLGVVLAADSSHLTGADDHPLKSYATQWGLDPIWRSSGSLKLAPSLADFPAASSKRNFLTLEELSGVTVHVAAHDVQYDKDRRLWFSDITVTPGSVYFPFVRLALARYQPNSIADAFLSRVAMTDYIQLVPDRTAAVTFPEPKKLQVQVAGVYGLNGRADPLRLNTDPHELMNSQFMVVTLERRAVQGDFGWVPVQDHPGFLEALADLMLPQQQYGAKMVWSATVDLPSELTKPRGQNGFRLVVKEYEVFDGQKNQTVPRLVYADVIEL